MINWTGLDHLHWLTVYMNIDIFFVEQCFTTLLLFALINLCYHNGASDIVLFGSN